MGNGRMKRTLEIDLADLLVLRDALLIGSTTAMMYGRYGAQERLKAVQEQIEALIEDEVAVIGAIFDSRCACEIIAKLQHAEAVEVRVIPLAGFEGRYWGLYSTGRIEVRLKVAGEWSAYTQDGIDRHDQAEGAIQSVAEALRALAPMALEERIVVKRYDPEAAEETP